MWVVGVGRERKRRRGRGPEKDGCRLGKKGGIRERRGRVRRKTDGRKQVRKPHRPL